MALRAASDCEVTPLKLTVKAPAKTVSKFSEDYFKVTLKNGKKVVWRELCASDKLVCPNKCYAAGERN